MGARWRQTSKRFDPAAAAHAAPAPERGPLNPHAQAPGADQLSAAGSLSGARPWTTAGTTAGQGRSHITRQPLRPAPKPAGAH